MTIDQPTDQSSIDDGSQLAKADARRWACETLGIEPLKPPEFSSELLRKIAEWEYIIPPDAIDAVTILSKSELSDRDHEVFRRAAQSGREKRLNHEVVQFAHRFFDLPVDERQSRWNDLSKQCHDIPALSRWLNDLKPGLDLVRLPASSDKWISELIDACRDVFTLREPMKTRRRQEFMEKCRSDRVLWERAAWKLRYDHRSFVNTCADWVTTITRLRAADREQTERAEQSSIQHTDNSSSPSKQPFPLVWFVCIAAVSAIARALVYQNQPSSPSAVSPRPTPSITIPQTEFSRSIPLPEKRLNDGNTNSGAGEINKATESVESLLNKLLNEDQGIKRSDQKESSSP